MYIRVLQDELHFPDDRAIDQDTKSLLRGVSVYAPVTDGELNISIAFTEEFSAQALRTQNQETSLLLYDRLESRLLQALHS